MSQQDPSSDRAERGTHGDPWHAFGYVVSGVAFYGFVGWMADRWLGTDFLVAVGILFGAVLGIYLTIARFDALPRSPRSRTPAPAQPAAPAEPRSSVPPDTPPTQSCPDQSSDPTK